MLPESKDSVIHEIWSPWVFRFGKQDGRYFDEILMAKSLKAEED
jgi:hypothetical protein